MGQLRVVAKSAEARVVANVWMMRRGFGIRKIGYRTVGMASNAGDLFVDDTGPRRVW
jgi:hypothetical protein